MPIDITDQPRRAQFVISGGGPYPVDWEILDETDIAAYRDTTLLALTTDYTVSIESDGTFSVSLVTATGTTLTVVGARPYQRLTDYSTGGDFTAATLNDELDSFQIQILQLAEEVDRSVRVAPHDSSAVSAELPTARANKFLAFDADGNAIASSGTGADTGLREDLADGTSGAALVVFQPAGATVERTVSEVLHYRYVSPESYGAVAYSTRAAALAGTDSTAAINAAIAVGRSVQLRDGYYKTTGGHLLNTISQSFKGAGSPDSSGDGGTVLVKASGTAIMLTALQTEHHIADFGLDGNSLGGSELRIKAAKYSTTERIRFLGQGGTDYALVLDDTGVVNLCTFNDLNFSDGNYGHIHIKNALYCVFNGIRGGESTTGRGILLDAAAGQCIGMRFYGTHFDNARIVTTDGAADCNFYGLSQEINLDMAALEVAGSLTNGFRVFGWRYNQQIARTTAAVSISAAVGTVIDGFYIRDAVSAAAHVIVQPNGALRASFKNGVVYSDNAFRFIDNTGITRSDNVEINNVTSISGGQGTNIIKSANITIKNSNLIQTFIAGAENITLENVTGAITRTNAVNLTAINCPGDTSPVTSFTSLDATPSVAMASKGHTTLFKTANAGATTITAFDDGQAGMVIHVIIGDANTTIDFTGTTLKGNGGSDWTPALNDSMTCAHDGTNWYCSIK